MVIFRGGLSMSTSRFLGISRSTIAFSIVALFLGCGGSSGGDSNPLPSFNISGKVTGDVISGVTITLSGAGSGTATTDASGNYTFTDLADGVYSITPSLTGYTFSPVSRTVTVNSEDIGANNFISTVNSGTMIHGLTIATGIIHTVAIKSDGTLWAWGTNDSGQVGDGTIANKNVPIQIGTEKDWAVVSAGGYHTVAIKTDGSLWAWGRGTYGQLGYGGSGNEYEPIQIGYDHNWAVVSSGGDHTIAIKSDGSLWAWGLNSLGQLGIGTYSNRYNPSQIGLSYDWNIVSAGDEFTVATKNNGSLWAWGRGAEGQLGDGTHGSSALKNVPAQVGSDVDWADVSAGLSHTLAIKTDGSLWAWGSNGSGELGDGTFVGKYIPTKIGTDENWNVESAKWQSMAIKTDGSLWIWGRNIEGQLGDETLINHNSPRQIYLQ